MTRKVASDAYSLPGDPDRSFTPCNTNRNPYMFEVMAALTLAAHYDDQIEVSSDGTPSEWREALQAVQEATGNPDINYPESLLRSWNAMLLIPGNPGMRLSADEWLPRDKAKAFRQSLYQMMESPEIAVQGLEKRDQTRMVQLESYLRKVEDSPLRHGDGYPFQVAELALTASSRVFNLDQPDSREIERLSQWLEDSNLLDEIESHAQSLHDSLSAALDAQRGIERQEGTSERQAYLRYLRQCLSRPGHEILQAMNPTLDEIAEYDRLIETALENGDRSGYATTVADMATRATARKFGEPAPTAKDVEDAVTWLTYAENLHELRSHAFPLLAAIDAATEEMEAVQSGAWEPDGSDENPSPM